MKTLDELTMLPERKNANPGLTVIRGTPGAKNEAFAELKKTITNATIDGFDLMGLLHSRKTHEGKGETR